MALTTECGLQILICWLRDNIDCCTAIIFDNDEDQTDSAALLPRIEQALADVCKFHRLQQLLTPAIHNQGGSE